MKHRSEMIKEINETLQDASYLAVYRVYYFFMGVMQALGETGAFQDEEAEHEREDQSVV